MKNIEYNENLCGPFNAESFETEYEKFYVKSSENIKKDKYISSILGRNRVVLTGVRGTGKTMILKVAHEVLEKEIMISVEKGERLKVLPIYVTFSGFKEEISLQDRETITSENLIYAKEIFRSYLFITLLREVLVEIEKVRLDSTLDFNFFGIRTTLGIKKKVDKAIKSMKIKGFKELTEQVKIASAFNIPIIEASLSAESGKMQKSLMINDVQKVASFKDTIKSICNTYKIDCIHFFFDEVFYLNYLQGSFFDALFGFRNDDFINFTISSYPTFMDYGDSFDIPDDAKEVSVSNILYKPTKEQFEKPLVEMISGRISKFAKMDYLNVIDDDALKRLILIFNGNPRMLMQGITYLWTINNNCKITKNNITQTAILEMEDRWYDNFLVNQAKRYKTSIDKVKAWLKVIIDRIKEYNKRNANVTIYFAISRDIEQKYAETINLLHYCRFIEPIKITSLGGTENEKAELYLVTPIVLWAQGAFPNNSIKELEEQIKYSTDKDSKVQLSSLKTLESTLTGIDINTCPRIADGQCIDQECGSSFSEKWKSCPFHDNLSLETQKISAEQVDISELNLSRKMILRLRRADINTVKDILLKGTEGLKEVNYIRDVRSKYIYVMAKEYCDDNI